MLVSIEQNARYKYAHIMVISNQMARKRILAFKTTSVKSLHDGYFIT
jgi:hypothetical protein